MIPLPVTVFVSSALFLFALYAAVRVLRELRARSGGRASVNGNGKHVPDMRVRGLGLYSKLAALTMVVIVAVIYVVSISLYQMMVGARHEALLRGLWERSSVLLETLSAGAEDYMREWDVEKLGLLPARMAAVPEACFVTIIGGTPGSGVWDEIVWATNDPDILSKIDTPEFLPGVSRPRYDHEPRLREAGFDPDAWDGRPFSEPDFLFRYVPPGGRQFTFFWPIAHIEPDGTRYFHGFVKMGVCTGPIDDQIRPYMRPLRLRVLLATALAFAVSALGVFAYSSVAAARVRKLLSHARLVLDTKEERELARMEIRVHGQDELSVLGNVFNGITRELSKTAVMTSGLASGKKLQRKLLPLDTAGRGETFDFSHRETDESVFFAYYEEAQEISGDYFDYRNLDGRYYALIKCDVAGSGIPAALITMQVSTMFLSYFWSWDPGRVMYMEELVYMINGFIERMGASRRFAAFTFCIYDSRTGDMHFCNAGDNIVRVFDASEKRVKTIVLPETPAAGILENDMVESSGGGYGVKTLNLDRGDVLLLYTDGLEESRRRYRGPVFDGRACSVGANRVPHGNYIAGQWGEELGSKRIYQVIDAVGNRGSFRLHKWHIPDGREEFLNFDFSGCSGGVKEIITALAAVEKMFRCHRAPDLTADDRVLVDKEIDAFLRQHFLEYGDYLAHAEECPGDNTHIYYTYLREDPRHDDMAILGLERK